MPRLFSALEIPGEAVTDLDTRLRAVRAESGSGPPRWVPAHGWHITVGFYGDDDPDRRDAWLRTRVAGLAAPWLRLAGAGRFPGVLWIGVDVPDQADRLAMTALAEAARDADDPRRFRPHLTVARWRRGAGSGAARLVRLRDDLDDYAGPLWTPPELVLMRSDPTDAGPAYTPLERYPLTTRGDRGPSTETEG